MGGIAGVAHRQGVGPVARGVVETMCAALRHRGPDDRGIYLSGPVALGQQRLSIVDPLGSNQPIFNEDGTKAIVLSGQIYNYRELRQDLASRGHVLRTQGDAEVVLHLYEEIGLRCVNRLRGMFALAIWDDETGALLLARDRFGIQPLYLARAPWGIAFASEMKALHAAGMISGDLDWDALDTFLQLGHIPAPSTPFRGVKKLDPGHTLLWRTSGEINIQRYWDLPEESVPAPAKLEEQVLSWLDESVAIHTRSEIPKAVFLSGGLDSSAVVSSATLSGEHLHAFTARFAGRRTPDADESLLAKSLAGRYGAAHTCVDMDPDLPATFERVVTALDEPNASESAIPTWVLSQAVSSNYKVAISGVGGDELFGGHWRHIAVLLGGEDRAASTDPEFPDRFLSYMNPPSLTMRRSLLAEGLRETVTGNAAQGRLRNLFLRGGCRSGLAGGLYLDYKTSLPDSVLAMHDRMGMAHSLEIRFPLIDHGIVEQVFRLPDKSKVRWCVKKLLLRRALEVRLPREHLRAAKRSLAGPNASWLREELKPMLQDELSATRLDRLGYFDSGVVLRLLDEHFSRRENHSQVLWALLCLSTWHRVYLEGKTPARYQPEERAQTSQVVGV